MKVLTLMTDIFFLSRGAASSSRVLLLGVVCWLLESHFDADLEAADLSARSEMHEAAADRSGQERITALPRGERQTRGR